MRGGWRALFALSILPAVFQAGFIVSWATRSRVSAEPRSPFLHGQYSTSVASFDPTLR